MVNPEHLIGKVIDGHYSLTRYVGSGTFGHVFQAVEEILDRDLSPVAVKLIYPGSAAELTAVQREIQGLSRFRHDHIITYHASGPRNESLSAFVFVVTELADTSLSEWMRSFRPPPDEQLLAMARGIASALEHIHGSGAVHRDVKPENIFRVGDRWKLGDFGFTRPVEGSMVQGSCMAGTPVYMAPEAFRGEIGPPTDVYALGVTLWECLSGRRAHEGSEWSAFASDLASQLRGLADEFGKPWNTIVTAHRSRKVGEVKTNSLSDSAVWPSNFVSLTNGWTTCRCSWD